MRPAHLKAPLPAPHPLVFLAPPLPEDMDDQDAIEALMRTAKQDAADHGITPRTRQRRG